MEHEATIQWIREIAASVEIVVPVCTGALLLAQAELLANQEATTYHIAFQLLRELEPTCTVHEDRRFVDTRRNIILLRPESQQVLI